MARGSAAADYDNDGDLDVVINSIGQPAVLLSNISPAGNWLVIDFGTVLPGTLVEVILPDGTTMRREVHVGSSYLASEDPRVHFGLADSEHVSKVVIHFPNGETKTYEDISINQFIPVVPAR
jgi:hypothetical protein